MNHSMISAGVSLQALQQKLDIIANNVANVNTAGYKRKDATFEDILTNIKSQPDGFQKEGRLSPPGFNQAWGARLSLAQLNLAQGTLQSTGVATDLALEGGAMFEVGKRSLDENGNPVVQDAYTRDGSFQMTPVQGDPDYMYLATKAGDLVHGVDGQPIKIPAGKKFTVEADGTVIPYDAGGAAAGNAEPYGKLKLVRVVRPQYLQQLGDNLYTLMPGVTNVNGEVLQNSSQGAGLSGTISVRQGFLEQSNVDLADEMTELMTTQRAFQLTSRALSSADQMMNMANNLRG